MVSIPLRRPRLQPVLTSARLVLTVVVAFAIAVPVAGYIYAHHLVVLGAHVSTPAVHLPPAAQVVYSSYASTGPSSFVVLGYTDLTTHPNAQSATKAGQTVGATAFAAQLAMLRAAGFTSVTADQAAAYLTGSGSLPRHAVLITFDGGRERDWTVADGLLARYGFSAVVFVDPEHVAGRGSGFLSWTQLSAMSSSGRWSVALDLSGAGTSVAIDSAATMGPAIVSHAWLTSAGRPESSAEYEARIRSLLRGEISALTDHGLNGPRLVMYPFDANYPLSRVAATFAELTQVVNSEVAAGVLRLAPDTSVTDFYRTERLLPLLPVFSTTTTDGLFARIEAAT
jgi:biofilm PGA synthesis lipoprotein PgaB